MSRDYKVKFRDEKELALAAERVRKRARKTGRYTIDVIDFIERILVNEFGLVIKKFDGDRHDDPASVEFRKKHPRITLRVRRQVWDDAKRGASYAYFVLAHEIAHILFHDNKAVAFTNDSSFHIQYALQETSAEWQADTFAKYLTMPDRALRESRNSDVLAILCNVEKNIAEDRVKEFSRTGPMVQPAYEGDPCGRCSNFTLVRSGTSTICDTCGGKVDECRLIEVVPT